MNCHRLSSIWRFFSSCLHFHQRPTIVATAALITILPPTLLFSPLTINYNTGSTCTLEFGHVSIVSRLVSPAHAHTMRLRLVTFVSLGLAAFSSLASSRQSEQSNLTLYGAPRHNLDGVLPVLSIEEQYIRAQTDGIPDKASGAAVALQCSAASPCYDGSCCNSQG